MNIDKSKAIVTTSKFLEIKKELEDSMNSAERNDGLHGMSALGWKLTALESGIKQLCDLLHELIVED